LAFVVFVIAAGMLAVPVLQASPGKI